MIRHIVLIRFKPDIPAAHIDALFDELAAIQPKLPGMIGVSSGRSQSPEQIERGFMHGFVADFDDWPALQAYQDHPDHRALGGKLVDAAAGGMDGLLVFDYEVSD